jgi:hypothetical protein
MYSSIHTSRRLWPLFSTLSHCITAFSRKHPPHHQSLTECTGRILLRAKLDQVEFDHGRDSLARNTKYSAATSSRSFSTLKLRNYWGYWWYSTVVYNGGKRAHTCTSVLPLVTIPRDLQNRAKIKARRQSSAGLAELYSL